MSSEARERKLSSPSRFALRFIETYRYAVSPRLGPGKCRFRPTCSQYALEALRNYSFLRAAAKTTWRILRCNPWNRGSRTDPP